jgi:hypothetical protein
MRVAESTSGGKEVLSLSEIAAEPRVNDREIPKRIGQRWIGLGRFLKQSFEPGQPSRQHSEPIGQSQRLFSVATQSQRERRLQFRLVRLKDPF